MRSRLEPLMGHELSIHHPGQNSNLATACITPSYGCSEFGGGVPDVTDDHQPLCSGR
jgi:hypothetical protein